MNRAPFGSMPERASRAASTLGGALPLQVWIVMISALLASAGLWWLFAHRQSAGLQNHAVILMAAASMWTVVAAVTAALRAVTEWWACAIIVLIITFCLLQGLTLPSTSLRWVTLACLVGVPLVAVLLLRPSWVGVVCGSCAASAVIIALHLQEPGVIRWYVAVTLPAIVVVPTVVMRVLLHRLELARARAAQIAGRDPLTGLSNRYGLYDTLPMLSVQAAGARELLVMALADVDHFKAVNDEHGHQAGDAVLVGIAGVLRGQARARDVVVRMGGEEIAWVFTAVTLHEAHRAAERLRVAVQEWHVPGLPTVTVSIGVAACCPADRDAGTVVEDLYGEADKALYSAKATGRNRVHAAEVLGGSTQGGVRAGNG